MRLTLRNDAIGTRKSTIYDLARMADVSASTVSAVLSGRWQARRIADDTARRILELASTMPSR